MNELEVVSIVEVEDLDYSNYRWRLTDNEISREVEVNRKERRSAVCIYRGERSTLIVWEKE